MRSHNRRTFPRMPWLVLMCSALLFSLAVALYAAIPSLGGWFSNDDFPQWSRFHDSPRLLDPDLLRHSFFRPMTRNLFWWVGGRVCDASYGCFFAINLSFLIAGLLTVSGTLWAFLLRPKRVAQWLTWCAATLAWAAFLLAMPSTIALASWVSTATATFPLLLFGLLMPCCLLGRRGWHFAAVVPLLILLAFSNIGYFLPASVFAGLSVLLSRRKSSWRTLLLLSIPLLAVAIVAAYKVSIIANTKPDSPYVISWDVRTLAVNLKYYLHIDPWSILSFLFAGCVLVGLMILRARESRSTNAIWRLNALSIHESSRSGRDFGLLLVLWLTALVSMLPYLPQTLQRYDYYIHLFAVLSQAAALVAVWMLFSTVVSSASVLAGLCVLLAFKWMICAFDVRFNNYLYRPRGSESLQMMRHIYAVGRAPARPARVCLVPQAAIRRDRSHPYYPDAFWWTVGFGQASIVYATAFGETPMTLSHASFAEDCRVPDVYEVDASNNLVKVRSAAP